MRKILFACLLLPLSVFAQIGGASVFSFTSLPYSARENAFGGTVISSTQKDVAFALKNPALLDSTYNHDAFLNFGQMHIFKTALLYGTVGYAHACEKGITMAGGLHFVSYGKCEGYDEDGYYTGDFFPSEYELIVGASKEIRRNLFAGVAAKPIMSYLESYSSYGLLFDIGLTYRLQKGCIALEARNFGFQLKPYTHKNREPVDFSIDVSYSQKLEHAPIRFNIAYQDVQKFDLSYENTLEHNASLLNDEAAKERKFVEVGKNLLKHINISAEFLIGKNIVVMGGYNYRKSEELSFGSSKHAAGLSIGAALNFAKFQISYSLAKQQAAGAWNVFTVGVNTATMYSLYQTKKSSKSLQQ